jgi:hypothetical protein
LSGRIKVAYVEDAARAAAVGPDTGHQVADGGDGCFTGAIGDVQSALDGQLVEDIGAGGLLAPYLDMLATPT